MYHRIKEYKNILIWVCLSIIVNILMCINLLEEKHVPFYGIISRKGLLLAQIVADLGIAAICLCGFYLAKKRTKLYTAVMVGVSPLVNICIMEGTFD